MAKTYQANSTIRFVNRMMQALVRLGLGPKQTYILTVRGRKSGKLYSTPVSLVEEGADRWLVAPYGEVSPDAVLEAFVAEAPRHPVFRINPRN